MKRLFSAILILLLTVSLAFGTVSSSTSRIKYNANGVTVAFPFTFGVGDTDEIQVILTDAGGNETVLTETTNYTVGCTNDDCESGGTVTTVATYATGNTITVLRNVPVTQETDFTEGMPSLYETFEDSLDKNIRIDQQQQEQINRSPKLSKSSAYAANVYTLPDPDAGKIIGWNAGATDLTTFDTSAGDTINITTLARISDYGNNIATAVTAIGASEKTLLIDVATTGDTTVPSNINLWFIKGGSLSGTVTIYSPANIKAAPNQQIFTGAGTVEFTIGGTVYPEWSGDCSDVAVDSGAIVRAAVNSIPSGNVILSRIYLIDSGGTNGGIDMKKGVYLKGTDNRTTGLKAGDNHPAKPLIYMIGLAGSVSTIGVSNISLAQTVGSAVTDAIFGDGIASSKFDDLVIDSFAAGAAIHLAYAGAGASGYFNQINNPYLRDNLYGVWLEGNAGNAPNCTTIIGGEIVGVTNAANGIRIETNVTGTYVLGTDIENVFSDALLYMEDCQNNFISFRAEHTAGTDVLNVAANAINNYVQVNTQGNYTMVQGDLATGSVFPSLMSTQVTQNLTGVIAEDLSTTASNADYRQQTKRIINIYDMSADGYIKLGSAGSYPPGTEIRINRFPAAGTGAAYILRIKSYSSVHKISTGPTSAFQLTDVTLLEGCSGTLISQHSTYWNWYPDKQILADSPAKGFWYVGAQVWDTVAATGATPGWICVYRFNTTLNGGEPSGEVNMVVTASTGALNGDIIGVTQDDGTIKWTTIASGQGTTTLVLTAGLTDDAATGNAVYIFRFKAMANLS